MIFYRGDGRGPEIILKYGFEARAPMTAVRAAAYLRSWAGTPGTRGGPIDLSRYIIASPKPEFISTSLDEDCSGYEHRGYIYRIEIERIHEASFDAATIGDRVRGNRGAFAPRLLIDGPTVETSRCIAIAHARGTEVTFLTGISPIWIRLHRAF